VLPRPSIAAAANTDSDGPHLGFCPRHWLTEENSANGKHSKCGPVHILDAYVLDNSL